MLSLEVKHMHKIKDSYYKCNNFFVYISSFFLFYYVPFIILLYIILFTYKYLRKIINVFYASEYTYNYGYKNLTNSICVITCTTE